jgi:hypothetical protein
VTIPDDKDLEIILGTYVFVSLDACLISLRGSVSLYIYMYKVVGSDLYHVPKAWHSLLVF